MNKINNNEIEIDMEELHKLIDKIEDNTIININFNISSENEETN